MEEFEKMKDENGHVAVIVSSGFGAGWSTWNDASDARFLSMDKTIVKMKMENASTIEVEEYAKKKTGKSYICTLGWSEAQIVWIEEGTQFYIDEYDGSESIVTSWRLDLLA